jgi:hypothetical protein
VALKYLSAKKIDFALKHYTHPRSLKAEIKTADASKERGNTHIDAKYRA